VKVAISGKSKLSIKDSIFVLTRTLLWFLFCIELRIGYLFLAYHLPCLTVAGASLIRTEWNYLYRYIASSSNASKH
jgi:hypothetical protein